MLFGNLRELKTYGRGPGRETLAGQGQAHIYIYIYIYINIQREREIIIYTYIIFDYIINKLLLLRRDTFLSDPKWLIHINRETL